MKRSLKAGIAVTSALALIGGGVAYAYFTDSAVGATTVSVAATTGNLSVVVSATGGDLSPGGAGQTVTWTATNGSTQAITLTSASISVAQPDGQTWVEQSGCSAYDFEFADTATPPTQYGSTYTWTLGSVELAPGAEYVLAAEDAVTFRMINQNYNQNGCKGASVPLYLNVG